METNLKKIERTSKLKKDENWEFRAFLKGYDIPLEEIDSIVHELFDYVSSEIDMEFILMQRKPGGYRKPTQEQRKLSKIDKKDFNSWFRQIWNITGASTRTHPAPFPLELASRLVRMFSFTSDTVLDPFCGTGTTMIAAVRYGRNSIGIDIDPEYCRMAASYLKKESSNLFINTELIFEKMISDDQSGKMQVCEEQALYKVRSARKIMN